MVKILAKVMIEDKMKKSHKFIFDEEFEIDHFFEYIREICEFFDSPTPVILAQHIRDFIVFNHTTFKENDFVEKIHFDKLIIESIG